MKILDFFSELKINIPEFLKVGTTDVVVDDVIEVNESDNTYLYATFAIAFVVLGVLVYIIVKSNK